MTRYIIKRTVGSVLILVVVSIVTFGVSSWGRVIPLFFTPAAVPAPRVLKRLELSWVSISRFPLNTPNTSKEFLPGVLTVTARTSPNALLPVLGIRLKTKSRCGIP
jgi:hypothetical protein